MKKAIDTPEGILTHLLEQHKNQYKHLPGDPWVRGFTVAIETARDRIKALPSGWITKEDIESLQRYDIDWDGGEHEDDEGEYVRYQSLIDLFSPPPTTLPTELGNSN